MTDHAIYALLRTISEDMHRRTGEERQAESATPVVVIRDTGADFTAMTDDPTRS